jgi:DNA-binding NarL/FixJ family response regulator
MGIFDSTSHSIKRENPKIVIADNQDHFKQKLKLALENAGMEVVKTANTGRQAVATALECEPNFLLLDVALPDMDGLAALATIKFFAPEIFVIVTGSVKDPCCKIRALELGADAYFPKESNPEDLIETMYDLFAHNRSFNDTGPNNQIIVPTIPRVNLANYGAQYSVA